MCVAGGPMAVAAGSPSMVHLAMRAEDALEAGLATLIRARAGCDLLSEAIDFLIPGLQLC
jgi:hypothetical protein